MLRLDLMINMQKCSECNTNFFESSISFMRRTKDILNPLPCLCKDCERINKALNPTKKDIERWENQAVIKDKKLALKNIVKNIKTQESVNHRILISKEQDRKDYRVKGNIIRAKRKKAYIPLEKSETEAIKNFYDKCPPNMHVDHIIPISKGGKHCLFNLQYLPTSHNISKGNKIFKKSLERKAKNQKLTAEFLIEKFKVDAKDAESIMIQMKT